MELSDRIGDAFQYALSLHRTQRRKETDIPYLSHLMAAASTVLDNGGDEEQAIAALLHDGPEDQGGLPTLEEIRRRFGDDVATIVNDCTDTLEKPKPDWRPRKEAYLEALPGKSTRSLLVSVADKLHNARAILADYREIGDRLWGRFNGSREETLWYYRELVRVFQGSFPSRSTSELVKVVAELEKLVAGRAGE